MTGDAAVVQELHAEDAADLRSMTQGHGVFSMKFLNYGRVPGHLLDDLVAKLQKEREAEAEAA